MFLTGRHPGHSLEGIYVKVARTKVIIRANREAKKEEEEGMKKDGGGIIHVLLKINLLFSLEYTVYGDWVRVQRIHDMWLSYWGR